MTITWNWLGRRAVELHVADVPSPLLSTRLGAWADYLRTMPAHHDVVAGLVSIAVYADADYLAAPNTHLDLTNSWDRIDAAPIMRERQLAVRWTGEDLPMVAACAGLTSAQWISEALTTPLTVGCVGFVPGFSYLLGLDPRLTPPRRSSPRPRVAAGSVAVAAGMMGVYPRETPGGWHIIGHTDPAVSSTFAVGERIMLHTQDRV